MVSGVRSCGGWRSPGSTRRPICSALTTTAELDCWRSRCSASPRPQSASGGLARGRPGARDRPPRRSCPAVLGL